MFSNVFESQFFLQKLCGKLNYLNKLNTSYISAQLGNTKTWLKLSLSNINITDYIRSQLSSTSDLNGLSNQSRPTFQALGEGLNVRTPVLCCATSTTPTHRIQRNSSLCHKNVGFLFNKKKKKRVLYSPNSQNIKLFNSSILPTVRTTLKNT